VKKKCRAKVESTVTIPLSEYQKMQDDIECLTGTVEAQIEAMKGLADKIRKLENINAEIKGKYSALWQMIK
jgi:ribosomal silencing factor RsfS